MKRNRSRSHDPFLQAIIFVAIVVILAFGFAGCVFKDVDAEEGALAFAIACFLACVYAMKKFIEHFSREDADEIDEYTRDMFV